jgi:uncharacterized membrane protein
VPSVQAMFGTLLSLGYTPRSWPDVLRTASTNAFALFGLVVLVIGLGLLIRAKRWAKGVGALAVVAGAVLLVLVLDDIKAETPSRRDSEQHPPVLN